MSATIQLVATAARERGLVILAGAGISMPAPTLLPGWWAFNDAVLDSLARRVATFTEEAFPASETLKGLRTLRDSMGALPPDVQAQLMEEECGPDYFRVLQALDTETYNAAHDAIAALAGTGVVRAIVTTNFDRLLERALAARGIEARVYYSPAHFEKLPTDDRANGPVQLIKVHGSVESPESMVDTLSQRVRGRPESLERTLREAFGAHAVFVAGFSGADLAYDPDYLGLRAGARVSPSFTVLNRAGSPPQPAMKELVDAAGSNARLLEGGLPQDVVALAAEFGLAIPNPATPDDVDTIRRVRLADLARRTDGWVESLGDVAAVNILTGIIGGASSRAAFEITKTVWLRKLHTRAAFTPAYWRFQVNIGRQLTDRGILGNDENARENYNKVTTGELDAVEPDDALRILLRAVYRGERADAAAHLARAHAYRGECMHALEMIKLYRAEFVTRRAPLLMLDAYIAAATVHVMLGNWSGGLEHLESIEPTFRHIGDEPRRARLCAQRGRFLAWAEKYQDAERHLADGLRVAQRLQLGLVSAEIHAAWGYLELDRKRPDEALPHLASASGTFQRAELLAPLLPTLLDLAEAALLVNQNELAVQALETVEGELDRFPGFAPLYHHRVAQLFVYAERLDNARASVTRLRETGRATGNAWAASSATSMEAAIARTERLIASRPPPPVEPPGS